MSQSHDPTAYWRTADGRVLAIVDMSTDHICKCIQLMERNHKFLIGVVLHSPPCFQGEMAQMAAESEWSSFIESDPSIFPSYEPMLNELLRRGEEMPADRGTLTIPLFFTSHPQ